MGNTPHFGWAYPVVGGSNDVWGDVLNLLFIAVDQALWALNPPVTGTIDNMVIGSVVPKAGTFASLQSLGNFGVNGDMQVNGNTTLNGNASVGGSLSVFSDFSVTGTANFSGPFNATGIMQLGAVGVPGELRFKRASDGVPASRIFELPDASGTGLGLEAGGNSPMVFYVGGTGLGANPERMRIDANGHVGIGMVPSATFDVLESGNGVAAGRISNLNTGANALAQWVATNGVTSVSIGMTGTAYGGGGFNVAASGQLLSNGANLVVGTNSTQPLILVSANVERMRVDASGNVGIGTSAPASFYNDGALVVAGQNNGSIIISGPNGGDPALYFRRTDTPGVERGYIQYDTTAEWMRFATNGGERMRLDANGNVGIGTVAPAARLHVAYPGDNSSIALFSGVTKAVRLGASAATASIDGVDNTGNASFQPLAISASALSLFSVLAQPMTFSTGGLERMRIDAAGNVTPGADGTQTFGSSARRWNTVYAEALADGGDYLVSSAGATARFALGPGWTANTFYTNGTERMRIDAAGNVGIGKNPARILDIQQDQAGTSVVALTNNAASGPAACSIQANTAGASVVMGALGPTFGGNPFIPGVSGNNQAFLESGGSSSFYIGAHPAVPMIFGVNRVERMRIDGSGTVTVQNPADNNYFLFSGSSKALRVSTSSATTFLHGTDATGSASYQPLTIGGLFLSLGTNFGEMIRIDPGLVSVNNSTDQLKALAINGSTNTLRLGTDANFASVQGTDVGGSQWRPIALGGSRVTFQVAGVEVGTFTPSNYFKASSTGGYPYGSSLIHEFNTAKDGQEALIVSHNFVANPYGLMIVFGGTLNNAANYFLRFQDPSGAKGYFMSNGGLWNTQANNANMSDENMKDYITPYNDKELDGLQASFCDVIWGKYKFKDQTHTDWNHGPTAQGVERAFALTAPELVDESDPALDKDTAPHTKHKGIYETDLAHIAHALLARALKEIAELKATVALLLGGKPVAA